MCLTTKQRFPKISLKPIIVYKAVNKKNKSPYLFFDYAPYIKNKSIFKDRKKSYKVRLNGLIHIYEGYIHAYISEAVAWFTENPNTIYKCIIPPFTRYYRGDMFEICSKRIKFLEIV